MTQEPKLLTEAEWHSLLGLAYKHAEPTLRQRGLVAPEPDALELAFGEAFTDTRVGEIGGWNPIYKRFRQIIKERGMELRPELTREMVRGALESLGLWWATDSIDRLHAALTQQVQP